MSKEVIEIFKKHQVWVEIVGSFGVSDETAEDIVQEMYIKIQKSIEKWGTDIMYDKDEINYYYIFKTLNSIFIDLKRRNKNVKFVRLDEDEEFDSKENYKAEYYKENFSVMLDFDEEYQKINNSLSNMIWYDRVVYEIIEGGETIAELSRKSKIQYYSLYNTYHKVKSKLKKLL